MTLEELLKREKLLPSETPVFSEYDKAKEFCEKHGFFIMYGELKDFDEDDNNITVTMSHNQYDKIRHLIGDPEK